MYHSCRTCRRE